MTHKKTTRKVSGRRPPPARARAKSGRGATSSDDLSAIVDLIAGARGHAADPTAGPRPVTNPAHLDSVGPTVADGRTDDHRLRELEAAARREVTFPADAFIVGERVSASGISYSGHPRAGLTLRCVRGGRAFSVGLADVVFPQGSDGARFVSLYRAWLGLGESPPRDAEIGAEQATRSDMTAGEPLDLIVLACKSNALRCRVLGTDREVTLRTAVRREVPGAIITVTPTKQWTHARHPYLAGSVLSMRVDVEALGLERLALRDEGEWDPEEEYWGEEGAPIEAWAKPIIRRGKRPMFEMEQVIPGADPDDFDSDPIVEAGELNAAGDRARAREILMNLLTQDLRCLDAHAHLGNFAFDRDPTEARRHYEVGLSIGAFSLGKKFDGVLSWGLVDNRPFLRCLNGFGLCAWRLGDQRTAAAVFRRMLWLNPGDNQGARFNLAAVEAGKTWEDMEGDGR